MNWKSSSSKSAGASRSGDSSATFTVRSTAGDSALQTEMMIHTLIVSHFAKVSHHCCRISDKTLTWDWGATSGTVNGSLVYLSLSSSFGSSPSDVLAQDSATGPRDQCEPLDVINTQSEQGLFGGVDGLQQTKFRPWWKCTWFLKRFLVSAVEIWLFSQRSIWCALTSVPPPRNM